ncbi:MAG: manganese efflux pump [Ignavibacteria bacterium]|nr:manganese efflux pump [Ignavibacteria bacterium]
MHTIEIVIIAFGLAMDAFTVSLISGTNSNTRGFRPAFRLSFHFGLFQFMMPVIGWYAGIQVVSYIEDFDHWIALILLSYVGIKMIISGLDSAEKFNKNDLSKGKSLVLMSVATSIDALAVGLSLALLKVNIWYPAVIIGVVTGMLSLIGVRIGNRVGVKFGKSMEVIGGVILILIGIKIVFEHLGFIPV